ncbi:hypothetical protein LG3211_2151 [Lysobacter gummosus]|nr:hypothetical protein LG3211_2151 [Lysobacter gummosus]
MPRARRRPPACPARTPGATQLPASGAAPRDRRQWATCRLPGS